MEKPTLTSWLLANAPLYDAKLEGTVSSGQVQVRAHPDHSWTNVTLPYIAEPDQSTVGMQVRVVSTVPADGNMSNFTAWNVEDLSLDMFGGQHPARPTLDFNLDERYEWGGEDARVGTWGWQDRFANDEERMELSLTSGAPSDARLWCLRRRTLAAYGAQSGTARNRSSFRTRWWPIEAPTPPRRPVPPHGRNGGVHNRPRQHRKFGCLGTAFTEARIEVSATVAVLRLATYNASQRVVADSASVRDGRSTNQRGKRRWHASRSSSLHVGRTWRSDR